MKIFGILLNLFCIAWTPIFAYRYFVIGTKPEFTGQLFIGLLFLNFWLRCIKDLLSGEL